jgi:hypothetical protein
MHNPGQKHWHLIKRILKYLNGTQDLRLCLGGSTFSTSMSMSLGHAPVEGLSKQLYGVLDADWAGDRDKARSTSGYCFFLGDSLLSWSSKLQATVSSSSTMAEYISAYHTTCEALWLRTVLMDLGLLSGHLSTPLFTDNAASMALSKFHMTTPRIKHLDSKFHLVRQEADSGAIQLQRVDTTTNVSDIFTKPLSVTLFYRHRAALGLC